MYDTCSSKGPPWGDRCLLAKPNTGVPRLNEITCSLNCSRARFSTNGCTTLDPCRCFHGHITLFQRTDRCYNKSNYFWARSVFRRRGTPNQRLAASVPPTIVKGMVEIPLMHEIEIPLGAPLVSRILTAIKVAVSLKYRMFTPTGDNQVTRRAPS